MKARWTQEIEREVDGGWTRWIPIDGDRHRIACCDCGLVHDLEFKANENETRLLMRAKRNKRSTAQRRRHHQNA